MKYTADFKEMTFRKNLKYLNGFYIATVFVYIKLE